MSVLDRFSAALDQRVLLADGSPVDIRPLGPDDARALVRLHQELPRHDHWLRFATVSDAGLAGYATAAAASGQVWGAFLGAELIGAMHLAPDADTPGEAEVAVTVGHRMQAHGVGTALLERAVRESVRRDIRRWTAEVLAENTAMRRVFADLGLSVTFDQDGPSVHVSVSLPDPDDPAAGTAFPTAALARSAHAARAGLGPVLRPGSIAVIGAGRGAGSVGRAVFDALLASGYAGRLHVVHPRAPEVGASPPSPRWISCPRPRTSRSSPPRRPPFPRSSRPVDGAEPARCW